MIIKDEIFRAYDIRGIVGESLSSEVAKEIGRAYCALLKKLYPLCKKD